MELSAELASLATTDAERKLAESVARVVSSPAEEDPKDDPWKSPTGDICLDLRSVSSLCHDLREPLAGIVFGAGALSRQEREKTPLEQAALTAISRGAAALGATLDAFQALARGLAGELRLRRLATEVDAALKPAIEGMQALAEERRVALRSELGAPVPALLDRAAIQSVVSALLTAALGAAPRRSTLVVRSEASEGAVHVTLTGNFSPKLIEACAAPDSCRIGVGAMRRAVQLAGSLLSLHDARLEASPTLIAFSLARCES